MKRVRDTSALALRELDLPRREQIVLDALKAWTGPAPTSYELTRWLQADDLAFDVNSVRPRLCALLDKGLIATGEKRPCRVTTRLAYTWVLTSPRAPQALPRALALSETTLGENREAERAADPEPLSFTWEVI